MMQYLKHAQDLAKDLTAGTVTPEELSKRMKDAIPPEFLAQVLAETPESIIKRLEPIVTMFMGKESAELLKKEETVKLLEDALVMIRAWETEESDSED